MGNYLRLSWDEFEDLTDNLIEKIPKNYFEQILCIGSGGLVLGKLISDRLSLPLSIISAKAYQKGNESKEKEFKMGGIASINPLSGNILIVDDLIDSGLTMSKICEHLNTKNEINEIKTATIYIKPSSAFVPDHYVKSTDKWIIFPYEKKEFENLK